MSLQVTERTACTRPMRGPDRTPVWSREDLNLFYLKSMAEMRELAKSWTDAHRPEHKDVSDAQLPHETPQVSNFSVCFRLAFFCTWWVGIFDVTG